MADDYDECDRIISDAISELELEQYTKREIVEKLREAADDIEGELNITDIQDVWVRGNE